MKKDEDPEVEKIIDKFNITENFQKILETFINNFNNIKQLWFQTAQQQNKINDEKKRLELEEKLVKLNEQEKTIKTHIYQILDMLDVFSLCSFVKASVALRYFITKKVGWKRVAKKYHEELLKDPVYTDKNDPKNFSFSRLFGIIPCLDTYDPDLDLPENEIRQIQYDEILKANRNLNHLFKSFASEAGNPGVNYFWTIIAIAMRNEPIINFYTSNNNICLTMNISEQIDVSSPPNYEIKINTYNFKYYFKLDYYLGRISSRVNRVADDEIYVYCDLPMQIIGIIYAILCIPDVYIQMKYEKDSTKVIIIKERICDTCDQRVAKLTCNICRNVNYCQSCGEKEIKTHIC